ncbi:hypothetical protein NUW58_g751 [Xylaria curta]|uniref:Uncharacterized protein n=1 Tax=Xylaria curta TaxID=42375 RepID=A0ACC1PN67_9PEZI|nr:hypothetical protein NUW58_g751 [Xylaria curta]
MALKRVALLALASSILAQEDPNGSGSPDLTTIAFSVTDVESPTSTMFAQDMDGSNLPDLTTIASDITDIESPISATYPPTTVAYAASGVQAGSGANSTYGLYTPTGKYKYSNRTMTATVTSSGTAGSTLAMKKSSPPAKTASVTSTNIGGVDAGGMSTPQASAIATGQPLSGNGAVNGVSTGLLLSSIALATLLQT